MSGTSFEPSYDLEERTIEGRRYLLATIGDCSSLFPISAITHIAHFASCCDHCRFHFSDKDEGMIVSKQTVPADLLP